MTITLFNIMNRLIYFDLYQWIAFFYETSVHDILR